MVDDVTVLSPSERVPLVSLAQGRSGTLSGPRRDVMSGVGINERDVGGRDRATRCTKRAACSIGPRERKTATS
jgi:hypothetical protein